MNMVIVFILVGLSFKGADPVLLLDSINSSNATPHFGYPLSNTFRGMILEGTIAETKRAGTTKKGTDGP